MIKDNRKAFEIEMENLMGKILSVYFSESEDSYVAHDLMKDVESIKVLVNIFNVSWLMWQKSISREGYKFVPVEPTQKMIDAFPEVEYDDTYAGTCMLQVDDKILKIGYKAMIEACNK